MSNAEVVCGYCRFVIDPTVVLDNLCSRLIRNNTVQTLSLLLDG